MSDPYLAHALTLGTLLRSRRPDLEQDIMELYALMKTEIEAGESPSNELDSFRQSLKELEEEPKGIKQ